MPVPADTVDVAARLRARAAGSPDALALVSGDVQLTYRELHEAADDAAAAVLALGVAPGDRVALVLGTCPTFVAAYAGVLRAGAVAVPLLPSLAPDELRYALAHSSARLAIVGGERLDAVVAAAAELPALAAVVGDVTPAALEAARSELAPDALPDGLHRYDEVTADQPAPAIRDRQPDELAALVYTSGTTGRPRGAMLTRGNLAANQDQSLAGRFAVSPDDVVLLVLPLAHIYSLNVGLGAAVTAGATLVLEPRFDPAGTLETMQRAGVSIVLGAPPMYIAWLEGGGTDHPAWQTVRIAASGAAPLPVAVFERFAAATGLSIEEGYGLTEASPAVATASMAPEPRPGSVGLPLPDVEVRVVDAEGDEVEPGDPGELLVRGPNVFAGYLDDEEATRAALDDDGWLHTGDIASVDADGYLYLVDRRRDLILVSGFNVYPREVERVLFTHPDVAQAAVVGEPHPLTGETVVAHVVAQAGATLDPEDLRGHCATQLARYKCPTRVELTDTLPHTATGKVRRAVLRGELDAATDPGQDAAPGAGGAGGTASR
ncbi:MAG: AMP-binding protein [Nitriliruptoraceae bacterium]|nr:AMP-binding protein [Nitriliruptoraceae bacterium]